jgi:hypothetical protein
MPVKVFLQTIGKEVEVSFGEIKNLFHQRLISGEDYVKAVKSQAAKALPGWETKAAQDVAEAEREAESAKAVAEKDAKAAEAKAVAAVEAAVKDAEALKKVPEHRYHPADKAPAEAVTDASSDNSTKKDGA